MDWVHRANQVFQIKKPLHFTNYQLCDESAELDYSLQILSPHSLSIDELGYPSWDPLTYCNVQGKFYFLPAMIRLSIETIRSEFYFEQFLFHLNSHTNNLNLIDICNKKQKQFVSSFIEFMIENFAAEIEENFCASEAFSTYELWSDFKPSHSNNLTCS